jgi:ABC-type molybdenum transport system ATPase subunit/photorepair protein PhrA
LFDLASLERIMITVKIENCNNVASAEIVLLSDKLNISYGMNGTGKSTIAKAIRLSAAEGDLSSLKTFGENLPPACQCLPPIPKVLVFDEDFVSTIVFRESEVIQNAFEVFIKTSQYEEKQRLINERLKEMHIDTATDQDYGNPLQTGQSVLNRFTKTNDKKLKKTGLIKSLVSSESIFNLPEAIQKFQPLMQRDYNVDWVGWKSDGCKYDDNNICPFCTTELDEKYPEEKQIFMDSYSKSNVKNIREMLGFFEAVSEYMDSEKREMMAQCIKDTADEDTVTLWVNRFYFDLEYLVNKIRRVIEFNSHQVKQSEVTRLAEQLEALKIDAAPLNIFNNHKTLELISDLNSKISRVISEVENLKTEIGTLKSLIGSSIMRAVKDINEFLDMAGINYVLEIDHKTESDTRALLKYNCPGKDSVNVAKITDHLSWGERNAFALVLFMHYAHSQNPDLVILDDPISSFDSNKKYAIINRLFVNDAKRKSLFRKTSLMLTHDFQPVIDFVVNSKPHGGSTHAAFLRNDNGIITQTEITTGDVLSFAHLLAKSARNSDLNGVHRVTSLRKLIEHTPPSQSQSMAYNLLSCLLHGKSIPTFVDETPMLQGQIQEAENYIKDFIGDFAYTFYYADLFTKEKLASLYVAEQNDYFKLQVFRVLIEVSGTRSRLGDPILKYIDEQFHVENDYVYYLDFSKYNLVPSFVLPRCTEFLQKEKIID